MEQLIKHLQNIKVALNLATVIGEASLSKTAKEDFDTAIDWAIQEAKNISSNHVLSSRFAPQPIDIGKVMEETLSGRKIVDDLGWTGEYRVSAKNVLDIILDLQNGR